MLLIEENRHSKQQQQATVPTTATPVSGETIVLDAGHGVPDERGEMLKLEARPHK